MRRVRPLEARAIIATARDAKTSGPAEPPRPLLELEQAKRIAAYAAGNHPLLKDRIAATRARLELEPDESYAIELFLTDNSDPARMERFLMRARDLVPLEDVYVIPIAGPRRYRIRVVYGAFPDRESAAEARNRLPPKYQKAFAAELRDFAELRRAI